VIVVLTTGKEEKRRKSQARSTHFQGSALRHAPPATAARGEEAQPLFRQF
jgi:hypothetical protein